MLFSNYYQITLFKQIEKVNKSYRNINFDVFGQTFETGYVF